MNILITGCRGQLGSEIQQLQKERTHTHVFYNTDREELDITSPDAIEAFIGTHKIDLIINCAAYTAVDKAESDQENANRLNHLAPAYLAEAMNRHGGSLIHISTDYVFDGKAYLPYREDAPTAPTTVYGKTKLQGEEATKKLCTKTMIIRTAWLYSIHGNNFVKTMLRLGRERTQLGVVADQIGSPTNASDLAEAIWTIIEKGIVPGTYHYTNEGVASWFDLAAAIHRIGGITTCTLSPLRTEEYPVPAPRPHYSVLDKRKLKDTYAITIPWWEDSLKKCIDQLSLNA